MRTSIVIAAIACTPFAAQAQTLFGAKAGANYSLYNLSITGQGAKTTATRGLDGSYSGIGWHLGMYFQYNLARKTGLRAELLWSARGLSHDLAWSDKEGDADAGVEWSLSGTDKLTRSYLEVPLLLALQLGDAFTLHVGPGFAVLMGNKMVREGTYSTRTYSTSSDTTLTMDIGYDVSGSDGKEGQRTTDIAAVLGGVYELESGLNFGLRLWYGFSSLEDPIDWTETKGMVLQASVGWNISDKRRSRRR
jgi:hypothetical protein